MPFFSSWHSTCSFCSMRSRLCVKSLENHTKHIASPRLVGFHDYRAGNGKFMKTILKPSVQKIISTLALLYISSVLWRAYIISTISDTFPMGFPFQFFLAWGPCQPGQNCSEFNWLYLVLDMLFWYVISAFAVDRIVRGKK